jgi:hypothetical protein
MSVVLPIPFGPTIAMRAPLATLKETPLKISVGPYDLESEVTVRSDMFSSEKGLVNSYQCSVSTKKCGWILSYPR